MNQDNLPLPAETVSVLKWAGLGHLLSAENLATNDIVVTCQDRPVAKTTSRGLYRCKVGPRGGLYTYGRRIRTNQQMAALMDEAHAWVLVSRLLCPDFLSRDC